MRFFKKGSEFADREDLLRGVRELRAIVTYQGDTGYYLLTDESNNELITEADLDNIVTESESININENSIISIKYYCKAEWTKTICKMVELNSKIDLPIGKEIKVKIGAKNQEDGEYYYVNIGRYYVFNSEYIPETDSYLLTTYDKMYESMIKYDGNLNLTFPCTHKDFLLAIFDKFGWNHSTFDTQAFNYSENAVISSDIYAGLDMTYRDVINDLAVTYGALYFNESNEIVVRWYNSSRAFLKYEDLKSNGLKITDAYDSLNQTGIRKVTLTNSEKMTYTIVEDSLISGDEYDLGNNLFIQEAMKDSYDYADVQSDISIVLLGKVLGKPLEVETIGILTIEPLDFIYIEDENYNLVAEAVLTEDTFTLSKGLTETLVNNSKEEIEQNYVTSTPDISDINNAFIDIKKANAEIVLKVDSSGNLAEVALNGDKDSGTNVSIKSDSIHLEGYTTINNGFSVDQYGNMTATSGKIGNWNIEANQGNTQGALYSDNGNYRVWIQPYQSAHGLDTWIFSVQENAVGKFYVDGRGDINANNIDSGGHNLNSSTETRVYFNKTFTNAPSVVITPYTSASGTIAPKVRNVTTTYFDAIIGGSVSGDIWCNWIAIG